MDAADLAFTPAAEQARLIAAGDVSSRELVQTYLDRIERLDGQLNAWRIVFAERALAEADQADARRGAGNERPLLGVPIAIKDDIDVGGEVTAWGTAAHGGPAPADAEVVTRLRGAGAVILGKTHVPEMTQWPFTETITFGATRNPWDLERTPGGSSGGTAAAVASGMVGIGVGSDGMGSIRIPSAWCGLFGIKPQRDRVPIAPHNDAWLGLSVNGPLTRSVADAALFLDAVTNGSGFAAGGGGGAGEMGGEGLAEAEVGPPRRPRGRRERCGSRCRRSWLPASSHGCRPTFAPQSSAPRSCCAHWGMKSPSATRSCRAR
jgi:amidase